jgi:hypothetical protein
MRIQPHRHRLYIEREKRELRFAGEVKVDAAQFDPESQKKLAEQTDTPKDEVKTPEQRAEESANAANDAIAKHNAFASKMTPDMAARLRDEIGGFMRTTVESFDRNGTEGLSVKEYDAYKANVESQIDQMFQSMGSSAQQVEQQATQQAEAEAQKAEQSAGNSELMGKSLEEIEAMLQQPLEALKDLAEINLETADAATLQQQLSLYQENVQAVQSVQEAVQQRGAIASSFHAKATEQMKTMSAEAETASASAAVAAGAATGAAIGVWGFGIGAFVGAGLGAAAGAIAYGIGRGLAAAALHAEKQKIADRVNAAVTRERTAIAAAREQVGGADGLGKLAAQGEQVNAAPEALRIRTDEKTAGETADIRDLADRTGNDQRETETKLGELENAIDSTEQADSKIDAAIATASASDNPEQRSAVDELRAKRDEIGDARMQMEDAREALSLRLGDFSEFIGQLQSTEEGVRISNEEEHARLDDLDQQLGGDVLVANVRTAQFQEQLGEDGARLAELPNIEPEAFFSAKTWSAGFDGFAAGVRFAIHEGIVPLIDAASASLKEVPVVGSLGYGLDVVSGVLEGVGDLGEGVATMLGHPVQTATGLATALGTAEGWRQIGGAIVSYEDFAKGNVGKGIGKIGLNILMTATGVGAAAKGAQAARIGYVASRAAGAGVLRSSAKAAWIGARVGSIELAQGTAKIPGNVAAGRPQPRPRHQKSRIEQTYRRNEYDRIGVGRHREVDCRDRFVR